MDLSNLNFFILKKLCIFDNPHPGSLRVISQAMSQAITGGGNGGGGGNAGDVGEDEYGPFTVNKYGDREYVDKRGRVYYINDRGYPYYVNKKGSVYYYDEHNLPYKVDSAGFAYYFDDFHRNERKYYISSYGISYIIKYDTYGHYFIDLIYKSDGDNYDSDSDGGNCKYGDYF